MKIVHIDVETFSEIELKDAGSYRYAEHESTDLNVLGWAVDDGSVHQWLPFETFPQPILDAVKAIHPEVTHHVGLVPPEEFCDLYLSRQVEKRAHNAAYERVILNGRAGQRHGFNESPIESWVCTAAKCSASGLPRALGDAAKALGTHPKSEAGRIEMLQLAKPRKPTKADPSTRWTPANAPEKWTAMLCYNIDDVKAERGVDNAVPDLTASEQEIYHLDQRINQRGIQVDLRAVKNILYVVEQYKEFLAVECERITANWLGDGLRPTQREKISDWVRGVGETKEFREKYRWPALQDMQAETIKALCKREEVPECVKQILRIYSTYNAKAVSKLQAILDAVCQDGRLRGMFLFLGAGTGRWSSLIVQLQNLLRPLIDDPDFALECFATRSMSTVQLMYPDLDLMKVAGSCIRAVLIAATGKTLLFPDFVGVETRINAWFWNDEDDIEMFKAQDAGTGPDSYKGGRI